MTSSPTIPHGPDSITAVWITEAMKSEGTLKDALVVSIRKKAIGEDESFTGGTLTRVELEYSSQAPNAARSLIVKLSPTDPEILLALKGH